MRPARPFRNRTGGTRSLPITGYPRPASSHPQKRPLTLEGVVEIGQKRLVLHAHGYREPAASNQTSFCAKKRDHADPFWAFALLGVPNLLLGRSMGSFLFHFHFLLNASTVDAVPD